MLCLCAVLCSLTVSAANKVSKMEIEAVLQKDGSAQITQTWTADTDEGTEFYLTLNDSGYLSVTDFTAADENGAYTVLPEWDISASFAEKARKCGVSETGSGVELCWGISDYGAHTYTISYVLHDLVGSYSDVDGFNYRFVDEMSFFPTDVSLTIRMQDGTPLSEQNSGIWGFGFDGQIQFQDGTIRSWSESPLDSGENMTVMVSLNKGLLTPSRTVNESFEAVKERAFDGSDYSDVDEEPLTAADVVILILVLLFLGGLVVLVILLPIKLRKAKRNRRMKNVDYFRDVPNGGNMNVTHRLGVCSEMCKEDTLLGAYLLRMIAQGCMEPVPGQSEKNTSLALVHPPREDATPYDDALYTILEAAAGSDGVLQPKELERFCENNYTPLDKFFKSCTRDANQTLKQKGCLKGLECTRMKDLTERGKQELDEVLGLRKYLLDFSLIRERSVQETVIWQEYLSYALLLGIADKVAPQIRRLYPGYAPQVDEFERYTRYAGYYNHVMYRAYERERDSREAARYSGSGGHTSIGGGGGFSGGGGGGTR